MDSFGHWITAKTPQNNTRFALSNAPAHWDAIARFAGQESPTADVCVRAYYFAAVFVCNHSALAPDMRTFFSLFLLKCQIFVHLLNHAGRGILATETFDDFDSLETRTRNSAFRTLQVTVRFAQKRKRLI